MFYVDPYLYATLALIGVIISSLSAAAFYKGWFQWDLYSYAHTSSSVVRPLFFFLFRLCVFLYAVAVLIVSFVQSLENSQEWANSTNHGEFFSYYTIWNYTMLMIFFMFGACISFTRIPWGKYSELHEEELTRTQYQLLGTIVWVLFEITLTMAILVDTVLWGILYPACVHQNGTSVCNGVLVTFESINCHAVNFIFIFIEFFLNDFIVVPAHCLFVLYWAVMYMAFAWIYHSQTNMYVRFPRLFNDVLL
eukprot:TRINITY_DN1635_c0_g1_i4.p1 TRINITY_DN1635_c0_g1~~TRINITY_DN1635_c0_g1_i4.p1  ORF type:complete len:250 (-),score=-10.80 TRINITY_DN1635_c0_g1_i4:537-1286(-)